MSEDKEEGGGTVNISVQIAAKVQWNRSKSDQFLKKEGKQEKKSEI